jgi:hypothetical protein
MDNLSLEPLCERVWFLKLSTRPSWILVSARLGPNLPRQRMDMKKDSEYNTHPGAPAPSEATTYVHAIASNLGYISSWGGWTKFYPRDVRVPFHNASRSVLMTKTPRPKGNTSMHIGWYFEGYKPCQCSCHAQWASSFGSFWLPRWYLVARWRHLTGLQTRLHHDIGWYKLGKCFHFWGDQGLMFNAYGEVEVVTNMREGGARCNLPDEFTGLIMIELDMVCLHWSLKQRLEENLCSIVSRMTRFGAHRGSSTVEHCQARFRTEARLVPNLKFGGTKTAT